MYEKTLIILKPDCLERDITTDCVEILLQLGRIVELKCCKVSSNTILKHYEKNLKKVDEDIKNRVLDYFVNKYVVVLVLEGQDIITRVRKIIGASDPSLASKGTIRGDFGMDSYEIAELEKRSCRNIVHASDSIEAYNLEYNIWFK